MNILVIDDQKNVVDCICGGMNWELLSVEMAFPAYSTKDAIRILKQEKIDIMLSDIEMPEMDGLSLYRWVKKQEWDIDCIFLTAHADFNYAKEAIHLGSMEYILQPAKLIDIEVVLKKVVEERKTRMYLKELEKRHQYLKEKESILTDRTFEKILENNMNDSGECESEIRRICHNYFQEEIFSFFWVQVTGWKKQEWDDSLVRMVLLNIISELFEGLPCEIVLGGVSKMEYVVLIHGECAYMTEVLIQEKIRLLYTFIQEKLDFSIAVYINRYESHGMYAALKRLTELKEDNIALVEGIYCELKADVVTEKEKAGLLLDRWKDFLADGSGELIYVNLKNFFRSYQQKINREIMKEIHLTFSKALFEVVDKKQFGIIHFFDETYTYDDFMKCYENCVSMLTGVRYSLDMLSRESVVIESDRISQVKKYISENISKNITRTEVAAHVYFNEDYFSRWFSKETGLSFKDYVMEEKLSYARQLLANTNFSIAIVASKIGCDNFSYFSKMFKKNEGITPQEYRSLHQ